MLTSCLPASQYSSICDLGLWDVDVDWGIFLPAAASPNSKPSSDGPLMGCSDCSQAVLGKLKVQSAEIDLGRFSVLSQLSCTVLGFVESRECLTRSGLTGLTLVVLLLLRPSAKPPRLRCEMPEALLCVCVTV